MAERQKGMGRGLAAILSVAPKDEPRSCASSQWTSSRRIRTSLARCSTRRPLSASRTRFGPGRPPAGPRPARLSAGATSWSPASAAGAPRSLAELDTVPADHPPTRRRRVARGRAHREHGPRGPEPDRGGAGLRGACRGARLTREEVGLRVGRSRVAVSNLIRLLDLPDEAIALLEQRRAQRRPRSGTAVAEDHTATPRSPVRRLPPAGRSASSRRGAGGRRRRRRDAPAARRPASTGAAPRSGRRRSRRSPTRWARRSDATSR